MRVALACAYVAFVGWLAWSTGTAHGADTEQQATAVGVALLVVWVGSSVLCGAVFRSRAWVLPVAAIVGVALAGELAREFAGELRIINWMIELCVSWAGIAAGVGLAHWRARGATR